jgi:hypothetical protein
MILDKSYPILKNQPIIDSTPDNKEYCYCLVPENPYTELLDGIIKSLPKIFEDVYFTISSQNGHWYVRYYSLWNDATLTQTESEDLVPVCIEAVFAPPDFTEEERFLLALSGEKMEQLAIKVMLYPSLIKKCFPIVAETAVYNLEYCTSEKDAGKRQLTYCFTNAVFSFVEPQRDGKIKIESEPASNLPRMWRVGAIQSLNNEDSNKVAYCHIEQFKPGKDIISDMLFPQISIRRRR